MTTNLRRIALLPLLALASAAFVGCGGSGNDSDPNPFRGTYPGVYESSLNDNGTIQVTIDRDGDFDGTIASTVNPDQTGTINGDLSNGGHFVGTVGSDAGGANFGYEGDLVRGDDGLIRGTLNPVSGQTGPTVTFVLGALQG